MMREHVVELFLSVDSVSHWLKKPVLFLFVLLLLLTRMPSLLAVSINNFASHIIRSEWELVVQRSGIPRCGDVLSRSKVKQYVDTALFLNPDHSRTLLNAGRSAWLRGDCSAATANWEKALNVVPKDQTIAFWLFWVSEVDIDDLAGLSVDLMGEYFWQAGERANRGGEVDTALEWYELLMDLDPNRKVASKIARIYQQSNHLKRAVDVWEKLACVLPEDDADHWWALGQAAELSRSWLDAAQAYGRGSEISDDPYSFLIREGNMLRYLTRRDEAEKAYLQALAIQPENPWPYMHLGNLRSDEGDYSQARWWYEMALEQELDNFYALYYYGRTYFDQEKYAEAQVWLEEALSVEPGNALCAYYLAMSYYYQTEIVQAIALLDRSIDLHPGQPWEWAVQLGEWRLQLGDREGALEAYKQALRWQPSGETIQSRIEEIQRHW